MRILWFSTFPGLAAQVINRKELGRSWVETLQTGIESTKNLELGYVFQTDDHMEEFVHNKTTYFPVKRIGSNKYKRFYQRLKTKLEYDENLSTFLNIIKKFNPDIIHIHGTENPFGLIIPHLPKIPTAISIQGNLNVLAEKYFTGIDKYAVKTNFDWIYNRVLLDYKGFFRGATIESEVLSHTRYILGRTDWDRRIMRVLAPNARYFHVDEIIRKSFYKKKWSFIKNEVPVFFTTSSENLYKGFETLLGAAKQLSKIKFSFRWYVAGLTSEDKLVKLAMKLKGISNLEEIGVRLIGKISGENIVEKMMGANIYVQVSHIENSPNSVCEAMLLGLPIIASNAGGTSSLIENNESGILIQDGDIYSLAGALIELTENKELATYLGKNAFDTAHKRHNPDRIIQTLVQTYSDIIKENKLRKIINVKVQ